MKANRLQLIQPIMHLVVIVFSYRAMYQLRQYTDLIPFVQLRIPVIDLQETMLFALCSGGLFVIIGIIQELYVLFLPSDRSYGSFLKTRLLRVILSGFLAWLGFGYVFVSGISRFVLIFASVLSLFIMSGGDMLRGRWNNKQQRRHPYRLLIVGNNYEKRAEIIQELSRSDAYTITVMDGGVTVTTYDQWSNRDACLLLGSYEANLLQERSDRCKIHGKELYHLPDGHFLEDMLTRPLRLGPVMVMAYIASPLAGWWRVAKRLGDIFLSFLGLLLLSPLLFVIALCIKRDSSGPVFYIQQRVGKNKRHFPFIKFRSMYTHLSTGPAYGGEKARIYERDLENSASNIRKGQLMKIKDDPRVTTIGRFLRKYSLDELPSLRCVLLGDMSLIGPRPHLPHEVEKYASWHERLFAVKPGITGYAQLYGRDKVPFDEEAKLDLRYIQHRSLWLDMYVLFATIKVVFSGK